MNKQYISIIDGVPISSYSPQNIVEKISYVPPVTVGTRKLSRRNLHGVSSMSEEDKLNLLHSDSYFERMRIPNDEAEGRRVDFSDSRIHTQRSRSFSVKELKDTSDSKSSQGISERKKKAGLFPNFFSSAFCTTTHQIVKEESGTEFISRRSSTSANNHHSSAVTRKYSSVNTYFTRSVDGGDKDKVKDKIKDNDFDKYQDVHTLNRSTLRQGQPPSQNHPNILHMPMLDTHHLKAIATTLTSPFLSHKRTPRSSLFEQPDSLSDQKKAPPANSSSHSTADRSPVKSLSLKLNGGAKLSPDKSSEPSYTYGICSDSKLELEVIQESSNSRHSVASTAEKIETRDVATQTIVNFASTSNPVASFESTDHSKRGIQHELSIVLSPMAFVLLASVVVGTLYMLKYDDLAIIVGVPTALYILIFVFHRP